MKPPVQIKKYCMSASSEVSLRSKSQDGTDYQLVINKTKGTEKLGWLCMMGRVNCGCNWALLNWDTYDM